MDCRVCYSGFDHGSHLPRNLRCGHSFCTSCLATLLHGKRLSCPECRGRQAVQGGVEGLPVSHAVLRILAAKYCESSGRGEPAFVPPRLETRRPQAWSSPVGTASWRECTEQILESNLKHVRILSRALQQQQRVAQCLEEEAERCRQKQATIREVKEELLRCKTRLDEAQSQEDIGDPGTQQRPHFKSSQWYADQQKVLCDYLEVRDE